MLNDITLLPHELRRPFEDVSRPVAEGIDRDSGCRWWDYRTSTDKNGVRAPMSR